MNYIQRYHISSEKLAQQFIEENVVDIAVRDYEAWLEARAQRLADAGNAFLAALHGDL